MKYALPALEYSFGALEPYIDAQTMELHYTKHHRAYIDKLNVALEKHPALAEMAVGTLLADLNKLEIDDAIRTAIKNHGGGHWNHSFFWSIMGPKKEPDQKLAEEIVQTFGSVEEFKKKFTEAALTRFGSGWAWLVRHQDNGLEICSTANQDCPLSSGHTPLIALDLWEHAYYLKYQNRRAEYIDAWWNILKLI